LRVWNGADRAGVLAFLRFLDNADVIGRGRPLLDVGANQRDEG
jgi:hypothetical protein